MRFPDILLLNQRLAAAPPPPAPDAPVVIFGANLTGSFDFRSASMTGASWTDLASVADLAGGGGAADPTAGTDINGRATLLFDGSDNYMQGGTLANRLTTAGGGVWIVGRSLTLVAGSGNPNAEASTWSITSGWAGATLVKTTGPQAYAYTSEYKDTPSVATFADNTVFAQRWSHDGATLAHKITGQAESTIGCGTIGGGGNFRVGLNWQGTVYPNMEVAAIYTCNVAPSAGQISDMDAWITYYWGVTT